MKTLEQISTRAHKLYSQLELGAFFDLYHDKMLYMVEEIDMLDDDDTAYAEDLLAECEAIIKAQKILNNVNIK